ncbi:MAG: phosphoenolpyruvate--protein phosphotransferase [Clostridium sp.]
MVKGAGASAGIGIGKVVILKDEKPAITRVSITDITAEKERFKHAWEISIKDITSLIQRVSSEENHQKAEILNGHLMLLQDSVLTDDIETTIDNEKICSEFAIEEVCNRYADLFAGMEDERMQQRAADMKDIKIRMQNVLLGVSQVDISALKKGSVLIAYDLAPSTTAGINPHNVTGIVTEMGGRTSHSAILARALEIPAIVAAAGILNEANEGDEIIFDGETGEIFINPDLSLKEEYDDKRISYEEERRVLKQQIGRPSITKDGIRVEIAANIGKPEDVERVLSYDGEGIGLFRTEFLFMDRTKMPTEEEQFEAYRSVASAMQGKPVIIRTLDIGGDKEIPYMGLKKDENPFLGYRAIRFCLGRKEDVYRPQLRALLRAGTYGNIKIMIPMVTCLEEVRETKRLISDIMRELDENHIEYRNDIPVGIMVETAAASFMADAFAKEVDFFSIGTNDLTQYTMAVDRSNEKVSYLYSAFNPAVLRSIRHIIECGHKEGIMVGMCGEAAGDPLMIPLLLAFGLNEFSMSAPSMLKARKLITSYHTEKLKEMADEVMQLVTADEIEQFMMKFTGLQTLKDKRL